VPPARRARPAEDGLTVAVTGPTGDIGRATIRALERSREVARIVGMARRPFDPAAHGWRKTEYRQGDVLDRAAVEGLVEDADVVVHLAFIIVGSHAESRSVNLEGSRNVFEAAIASRAARLVYTSSVAAYGFHSDHPERLTEEVPPRGTDEHYYSAQKAELEGVLGELLAASRTIDAYIFRPCIVAGADALALVENIPFARMSERLPEAVRRALGALPSLKPLVPDPGVPFQLVHSDDVATAIRAAVLGRGRPGVYNLAADDALTVTDLAHEFGWYAVPIPEAAVEATAELVSRLPLMPAQATWINALRAPVLVDTTKARRELRWRVRHSSHEVLRETVAAARERGLLAV
jgi:UDP-glucose 4-epimerase